MKRVVVTILAVLGGLALIAAAVGLATLGAAALRRSGGGISEHTVLVLDLTRPVVEDVPDDPIARITLRHRMVLRDVVDALVRGADDDRVDGLVVRAEGPIGSLAIAEEIRDAIAHFRESGKFAVAWAQTFGEARAGHAPYFVATACEEITMLPAGDLGLVGLSVEHPFVRGAFDKLDVVPDMDRRYEYKNAMNLYTETEFTDAHREATTAILSSAFQVIVDAIAGARDMTPEAVRAVCDRGPLLGAEAVEAGLVDRLAYRDEVYDAIETRIGSEAAFIPVTDYLRRAGSAFRKGETIALIYGVGQIHRGPSTFNPATSRFVMGADTVAEAFRAAVDDPHVRAIVFRVDCPGGSYVASDAVWREVVEARDAGKPVVVSMGGVAASGGYFVATHADRIVAHPTTLTCSIGVLGGKLVTRGLFEKLGLTWDIATTSANATMWSDKEPFGATGRERLEAWLDRVYSDFTGRVAEGREMPIERVREHARGRVWTGAEARTFGFVDEFGGYLTALAQAKELAGLNAEAQVRVETFPRKHSLLQAVLGRGDEGAAAVASVSIERALAPLHPTLAALAALGLVGDAAESALLAPIPDVR